MKIRPATVALTGFAATALIFASWRDLGLPATSATGTEVTESSRRVFADLGTLDLAKATLELAGPEGRAVRLVPATSGGHVVMVGDEVLGLADSEYLEGAWASLRIASALRSVPRGTETEAGRHGAIRIGFPDRTLTLQLGRKTPDGVGVYATLKTQESGAWVVEAELAKLVEQPAHTWVARRLLHWDVEHVSKLAFSDGTTILRGGDGLWRVAPVGPVAGQVVMAGELLSTPTVNLRLSRILSASVHALVDRQQAEAALLRPWLALTDANGASQHLMLGGVCPHEPHAVVVDRGPGRLVCIEGDLTAAWPIYDLGAGFLETQLIPHNYGSVAEVRQEVPAVAHLRRRPGAWELATGANESRYSVVVEAEVYRWFERLRRLSLSAQPLDDATRTTFSPHFAATVILDSGQTLALTCGHAGGLPVCRRDGGRLYPVSGPIDERMVLDFELLADRTMLSLPIESVRALEIDGPAETSVVRQSIREEYGQWQLEAPSHPDGNNALDQTKLETMLGVVATLRADRWTARPNGVAQRTLRMVHTPLPDKRAETVVRLFADCVVQVQQERHAQIEADACATLHNDLLFDDPLAYALREPRTVEVGGPIAGGAPLTFEYQGEKWTVAAGDSTLATRVLAQLEQWAAWRTNKLVKGRPASALVAELAVHRQRAGVLRFEVGVDWLRYAGTEWYYALSADAEPAANAP